MNEPRWIRFEEDVLAPGRVTRRWQVFNRRYNSWLGEVSWHGPWRQYCFSPASDTVFSADCQRDIANFIEARMHERKAAAPAR